MVDPDIHVQLDLKIPMRDGVKLYGAMVRPSQGDKFPVLLIRSPYSTQHPRYVDWSVRFAKAGYAAVMQDCRGRFESEGKWRPYVDEAQDGYDTQEWIGAQPWCDGTIGTFGVSYPGFTQILPAPYRSCYVKGLVPIANQEDNYGHLRYNGILQLQNVMNWVFLGDRTNQIAPRDLIDWDSVHRRLPLLTALDDIADRPFYREVIRHEPFDAFWSSYSMKGKYDEVETAAYFITGWYDNLVHEGFKQFTGWQSQASTPDARNLTKLLVGPWSHSNIGSDEPFGDVSFGSEASIDHIDEQIRWYDARLLGIDTGIDDEPPLRIFVMGENSWKTAHSWPLPETVYTNYYLHDHGILSEHVSGNENPELYQYDPMNPVPSLGGQYMPIACSGPFDRTDVEARDDVLVYSTELLKRDVEITGPILLKLYASSSSEDTDFTGTLVDVYPDRKAIILTEGILRARFRNSIEKEDFLVPGTVYEFDLDLWVTSNLFKAGHKIRLEISSSNFPRFDRNLNTGNRPGIDSEVLIANQIVYHDKDRPSHLILPVIPR